MLSIPTDFRDDPRRPTHTCGGYTVVDYAATSATFELPVAVTQPSIVFVHRGVKELRSGPGSETLGAGAGSIVVMRSGAHVMSDLLPMSGDYRSTIISIERETLRLLIGTADRVDGASPVAARAHNPDLASLASTLRGRLAYSPDALGQRLAIKELLVSTLLHPNLRDVIAADLVGWGPSHHQRITFVMDQHCYEPLSIPQFASMCAMSVSTFTRRFHEIYGNAPGRWLIEVRLDHAASLLATEQTPVTDVCIASGFGDHSHFTRTFKDRFGMSPSAYRTHHQHTATPNH